MAKIGPERGTRSVSAAAAKANSLPENPTSIHSKLPYGGPVFAYFQIGNRLKCTLSVCFTRRVRSELAALAPWQRTFLTANQGKESPR